MNYSCWYSFPDGSVGGWDDCVGDLLKVYNQKFRFYIT